MKLVRLFSFILCSAMILFLLTGAVPRLAAAEEEEDVLARKSDCLKCCLERHDVCRNVYPDARACASTYEACCDTCDSEGAKPSEWTACWSDTKGKKQ